MVLQGVTFTAVCQLCATHRSPTNPIPIIFRSPFFLAVVVGSRGPDDGHSHRQGATSSTSRVTSLQGQSRARTAWASLLEALTCPAITWLFYGCSYRFHLSGDNSRYRYIKGS